eukprot:2851437-Amphidinium_carterae.1
MKGPQAMFTSMGWSLLQSCLSATLLVVLQIASRALSELSSEKPLLCLSLLREAGGALHFCALSIPAQLKLLAGSSRSCLDDHISPLGPSSRLGAASHQWGQSDDTAL